MRKLFALMVAAVFGLGLGSDAEAAPSMSLSVVSGNPAAMNPGDSIVLSINYTIDIGGVTSATNYVDIVGSGVWATGGQTTAAGHGGGILTGFDLQLNGTDAGASCANSGGGNIRTCNAATGVANGAGLYGGLSFTGLNQGTYSVGTITITATGPGSSVAQTRIGTGTEWQQFGNDIVPQPSVASININVIPEPTTAALLGLGLTGLVIMGRRGRA